MEHSCDIEKIHQQQQQKYKTFLIMFCTYEIIRENMCIVILEWENFSLDVLLWRLYCGSIYVRPYSDNTSGNAQISAKMFSLWSMGCETIWEKNARLSVKMLSLWSMGGMNDSV